MIHKDKEMLLKLKTRVKWQY